MRSVALDLINPLRDAWRRMVAALFRPWRPAVWFTVGFGAWLAGLTSCGTASTGFNPGMGEGGGAEGFAEGFSEVASAVREHLPLILGLGIPLLLFCVALGLLLLWLSSRGQFLFVDNVARGRAAVAAPWAENSELANSLFWWRLGFSLVWLLALGLTVTPLFVALVRGGDRPPLGILLVVAPLMLLLVGAGLVIRLYLHDFVVPIMYRRRLRAVAAWGQFLRLFRRHPGSFLLYALWIMVLGMGVGIAVMVVGCLTCCVGWLILALPYLGTVLMLPVLYTYRAYSMQLLAQLSPEYDCFQTRAGFEPLGP